MRPQTVCAAFQQTGRSIASHLSFQPPNIPSTFLATILQFHDPNRLQRQKNLVGVLRHVEQVDERGQDRSHEVEHVEGLRIRPLLRNLTRLDMHFGMHVREIRLKWVWNEKLRMISCCCHNLMEKSDWQPVGEGEREDLFNK